MKKKQYYWIKLKEEIFQDDGAIDYLMSVPNGGSNYVVLYLKLCMMAKNSGGKLANKIGEMIIPYDVEKIRRDAKYFSKDTIVVALELYKKLGLVYADEDGILTITGYDTMVGYDTNWARNKALQRKNAENAMISCSEKPAQIEEKVDILVDKTVDNVYPNVSPNVCHRDKSIEIRDKSIYKDKKRGDDGPSEDGRRALCKRIMKAWNDVGINPIKAINADTFREHVLMDRIKQYGEPEVLNAIESIRRSSFLQGKNKRGWKVTFDWFFEDVNFTKVVEGNYIDEQKEKKLSPAQNFTQRNYDADELARKLSGF